MKKRLAPRILTAFALVVLAAPVLKAGDYHSVDTLYCQECHIMHATQAHAYTDEAFTVPTGPNAYLLRDAGSQVCLACHSNTAGIPDVSEADANDTPFGGRQGGSITTGSGDYLDTNGHTLGEINPPGGSPMDPGLRCYDCHAAHGNDNYRNVDDDDETLAVTHVNDTEAGNGTDVRVGVELAGVGLRIAGGTYSRDNIFFNEPTATESKYGDFCALCHGAFHGTGNTGGGTPGFTGFTRHPTENVDFSTDVQDVFDDATAHTERVQVMIASNAATGITDWSTATPSCMTCHKAHGSTNPFGLIYANGADIGAGGGGDEDGAGTDVNALCRRCHSK